MAAPDSQARLFAQLEEGYQRAAAACGEIVRDFAVAGTAVRLRFAGEGLVDTIAPGMAHPVTELPAGPCCEVLVWDSESTGVPAVPPPVGREDFTIRGNIWGFEAGRYRTAYHWGEGSVNALNAEARRAIYWVPSNRNVPAWVLSCPLRSILHWWLEQNGRQLVHGAVVGKSGRGVLLPGRGGAGKSSTSLACLAAGMQFLGDDYVALALDPEPRAYSLYATAKLDGRSLARYPELAAQCRQVESEGFEKAVLFLDEAFGDRMPEWLPLSLVLLPRITGRVETQVGTADPREVEWALSSGTLVHLPHVGAQTVAFLSRMSREVACAALELGTDREGIVTAIRDAASREWTPPGAGRDDRPFVSVAAALWGDDVEQWPAMLRAIEQQAYSRIEVLLATDRPDRVTESNRVHVQVLTFDQRMTNGTVWNRAVREAFAEWIVFLEPGERLREGAIAEWIAAGDRRLVSKDSMRDRAVVDRSDLRALKEALDRRRKQRTAD